MTKCIVKYDLDVGSNPEIESLQEGKVTFVRIDILLLPFDVLAITEIWRTKI